MFSRREKIWIMIGLWLIFIGTLKATNSSLVSGYNPWTGSYFHVGTGGTVDYATEDGDGYFKGKLEVDTQARLPATWVNSFLIIGGYTQLYSRSEAELKAITPSVVGQIYYDNTNKQVVVSTSTAILGFGLITDGSTPTGW